MFRRGGRSGVDKMVTGHVVQKLPSRLDNSCWAKAAVDSAWLLDVTKKTGQYWALVSTEERSGINDMDTSHVAQKLLSRMDNSDWEEAAVNNIFVFGRCIKRRGNAAHSFQPKHSA